jgi:hypothetical protein
LHPDGRWLGKSLSRQHIDPTVIRYIQNAVDAL